MADRIKTMSMDRENIWAEFDELTSDWDDQDMDDDLDEDEFEDDRDMDLDDGLFPDSRRVRFEDLDMDSSRRIPGVTFAGEPLTENLCAEYEYERDYVNDEFTPWSEIKTQPRIKHRAGVKVSRFSILNEDVATSGREVKIKTRRAMRKDDRRTTEKHKAVYRILDACARGRERTALYPCQCPTCMRVFSTVTPEVLRAARALGILRKNRGMRWTYDRWTNTIEAPPKSTFWRLPRPVLPAWIRPLPCPPVATDEVLIQPVHSLRWLDPVLAKNARLALRLFGRYVLPARSCHEDPGMCRVVSCSCRWMYPIREYVSTHAPDLKVMGPREFEDRLKYAPKVLVPAHGGAGYELHMTMRTDVQSAEARYLGLHRSDRGEFSSILYGEAMAPFEFEGKQGQIGDTVALWHYGRGQTTIAARTPRKDAPPVQIVRRTAQGGRKVLARPGHALPPARPSTGPARHVPGPARGLGPEQAERVTLREIHPGGLCPIQFLAPILILTRVTVRNWR
jgi:hypothetical protein